MHLLCPVMGVWTVYIKAMTVEASRPEDPHTLAAQVDVLFKHSRWACEK
jgi:hypothetical protein